ncbi:MAG: helix-turn-helix domain-containing protein [Alphaproteobacteria bacterium]|nr:helix-turn-helix domain-containing protein [Alphaproteobacteria bacterium]
MRALRYTSDAEPCIDLRRIGLLRYLDFSADSVARRLAAERAGPLVEPSASRLADAVLAYVACGLNAREAADRLGIHLNTVHNRLARVQDSLAPRDAWSPIDMIELAAAIRICHATGDTT